MFIVIDIIINAFTNLINPFLSMTGLPLTVVGVALDFRPLWFCTIGNFLRHRILFLTFALTLHYLSCITVDRFCTITSKKYKITHGNVNKVLIFVTMYVVITWLFMITENIRRRIIDPALPYCSFYKPSAVKRSNLGYLIIVAIWMTPCSFIICTATSLSVRFVIWARKNESRLIQHSGNKLETRRLSVTFVLSMLINWYGFPMVLWQRSAKA